MDAFFKMDVFFIVTTIAVIVISTLSAVALYFAIRILRHVEHIAAEVSAESEEIKEDVDALRADLRREGFHLSRLFSFFKRARTRIHKKDTRRA